MHRLVSVFALFLGPAVLPASPGDGPLHEVIPALFGAEAVVQPYRGEQRPALAAAAHHALETIRAKGVTAGRPNEVGHAVEELLLEALRAAGFTVDRPLARSGRRRAAGYPDLEMTREGDRFYVEVKTYHPRTENSTQRTFYLSPSGDPKVTQPAIHLLFAFAMLPDVDEPGRYRAESMRVLDLHDLEVQLKFEYNAGNDDLYGAEAGLEVLYLETK
ncbi:MAG: hypothetical protein ACLFU2_10885 [Opitutales bacterium]